MNRVSYNMGRIAFAAGEPYDPGADEFFVSYMMKFRSETGGGLDVRVYANEGTEWKTGWMSAQKEAADFFRNTPDPEDD